jgi:hypothetical protein
LQLCFKKNKTRRYIINYRGFTPVLEMNPSSQQTGGQSQIQSGETQSVSITESQTLENSFSSNVVVGLIFYFSVLLTLVALWLQKNIAEI